MAKEFKPGDKIAFLNYEGGGKVISILEGDQVMIELDEGFEIPVHVGEIVKEQDFTTGEEEPESVEKVAAKSDQPDPKHEMGLFLAFDQSKGSNSRELNVINNADYSIYFTLYEKHGEDRLKGISKGALDPGQTQLINRYDIQNFDHWPAIVIQVLIFMSKAKYLPQPISYTFKPRARAFFNAVRQAPLLGSSANLFRIDTNEAKVTEEPEQAKSLDEGSKQETAEAAENTKPEATIERPPEVIDLHIDRLLADYQGMEREAILDYQLEYFENILEKAQAHHYHRMIFIHGVGNGVLRERIHAILKKKEGIRSFKEADPQQYGYGATEVRIHKE